MSACKDFYGCYKIHRAAAPVEIWWAWSLVSLKQAIVHRKNRCGRPCKIVERVWIEVVRQKIGKRLKECLECNNRTLFKEKNL